jgi:hypothetical protein
MTIIIIVILKDVSAEGHKHFSVLKNVPAQGRSLLLRALRGFDKRTIRH